MINATELTSAVVQQILKAKNIVVICGTPPFSFNHFPTKYLPNFYLGAGISVAAGIPCFRGHGGIFETKAVLELSKADIISAFSFSSLSVSAMVTSRVTINNI